MRALQIALLVAAGAMAGAVLTQMWQRSQMVLQPALQQVDAPPPVVALVEKPTPAAAEPPAETSGRAAASRNEPAHAATPAPLPEIPQESPTPPPTPPARTEPEKVTPVPPPPPEPHRVTLNAGTLIPVRLVDGLSTERNKPGDRFTATLVKELVADDFVVAERGARVEGRVVASGPVGRMGPGLTVELTRLDTSDGQSVAIQTESFERRAAPLPPGAGGKIGAGSAMGPAGRVLSLRDVPATLPTEIRIPFRLGASVTLTERVQ